MASTPAPKPAMPAGSPRPKLRAVWPLVWELVRPRRGLLALGFVLMVINRVASLVLPYSTRFLIDSVIIKRHTQLLKPLVLAVLVATLIQGITSFSLTQLLSKAAQRLITELRQKVQAHVGRLPVSFHDSTKSGVLVSRIMSVVKGYHAEEREEGVFSAGVMRLLNNVMRTLTATSIMGLSASVLLGIVGAVIMFVGARQILAGSLTIGGFFTYTLFMGFLIAPIMQIVQIG